MAAMIPGTSAVQYAVALEMLVSVVLLFVLCWQPTGVFRRRSSCLANEERLTSSFVRWGIGTGRLPVQEADESL